MLRSLFVVVLIALQAAAASFSINAGDTPIAQVGESATDAQTGDLKSQKYVERIDWTRANKCDLSDINALVTLKDPTLNVKYDAIDFQSGQVWFRIYNHGDQRVDRLHYVFDGCRLQTSKAEVAGELSTLVANFETGFDTTAEQLEKKYFTHYTGGAKKFLTTAEYLLACVMMDSEIIDIQTTIDRNQITLNPGYTIYPNDDKNGATTFFGDVHEAAKSIWNATGAKVAAVFGSDATWEEDQDYGAKQLVALTEAAMTNVMAFVYKFVGGTGDILLGLQSTLFFTFGAASLALAALSKVTKKISEMGDYNDLGEKGIWLIGMLILFYAETASYHNDKENVSKTLFQGGYATLAQNMTGIADEMTQILATSYIDFKRKDAGMLGKDELEKVLIHKKNLEKQIKLYQNMYEGICKRTYRPDSNALPGFDFAPWELYNYDKNGFSEACMVAFPEDLPIGQKNFHNDNIIVTIDFCHTVEKGYKESAKLIRTDEKIVKAYQDAKGANTEQRQMELITEVTYRNTAELGFIYAPFIASTKLFSDSVGILENAVNTKEARTSEIERANNDEMFEKNFVADNKLISGYFGDLPYLMLPGADGMFAQNQRVVAIGGSLIKGLLKKLEKSPAGFALSKSAPGFEKGSLSNDIASIYLTTYFMEKILLYMPVVAIMAAALFVIAYYFISVFIYMLVSPFVMAYAFANQQNEIIRSYILRGVALLFKPLFIVLSVVIAIVAIDLIGSINNLLVTNQFDLLLAITGADNGFTMALTDISLLFAKGMLLIASSLIGILMAFYLVFYGSDMILKMFGFNEVGIDAQEIVGSQIEGKSGKFNTPMA